MRTIVVQKPKEEPAAVEPAPAPPKSDISLDELTDKHLIILDRETRHLLGQSAAGLLPPASGVALERCVKLIGELRKREKEHLADLTDEELLEYMERRKK